MYKYKVEHMKLIIRSGSNADIFLYIIGRPELINKKGKCTNEQNHKKELISLFCESSCECFWGDTKMHV